MALRKTHIEGFLKDTETGAVLNTNIDGFALIKATRERLQKAKTLEDDLGNLKEEVSEIKNSIQQILELLKR